MKVRGLFFASMLVMAGMVAFAFYTAGMMPEGAQLATRFDTDGTPLRYMDVLPALLINPLVLIVISLLFAAVPSIEPLQEKLEGSAPLLRVVWIGLLLLMPLVQLAIAAPAYGWDLPPYVTMAGVGALLIVMGNWLPKSRPGFFVGIRTPWTITDTDIWIATHRLGGKLMMLAGAVLVFVPFLPLPGEARALFFVAAIMIAAIIPVIYSWWSWNRKRKAAAAKVD
jgi:uncharacterized membrane protein